MTAEWLQATFLGSEIKAYLVAIATLTVGLLLVCLMRRLALSRLHHWARHTATDLDDRLLKLFDRHVVKLLYLGVLYLSFQDILQTDGFPKTLKDALSVLCLVLGTLLVVRLLGSLVEYGVRLYWTTRQGDVLMEQSLRALVPAIKVIVWAVGIIFLLDNMGFDVTAAMASLGIGGVALALASQGILADLFSYFAILFDRPFEIGDFIISDNIVGTIETVGIKTTRIRSLSGEEMVVANSDLVNSRIQNYKRMYRRRIVFTLGVTYDTAVDKLKVIPNLIRQAIENTDNATFDRAHFLAYGDFSLNYEVVYFVETNDYATYMDAQQTINLALKAAFEHQGIEFAYPTQLLYLHQTNAPESSPNGQPPPLSKASEAN